MSSSICDTSPPDYYKHLVHRQAHKVHVRRSKSLGIQLKLHQPALEFKIICGVPGMWDCQLHEKIGQIKIFFGILLPQVCIFTLKYIQIVAVLATCSAAVALGTISDRVFTMIYEPTHWPTLVSRKRKRDTHINAHSCILILYTVAGSWNRCKGDIQISSWQNV